MMMTDRPPVKLLSRRKKAEKRKIQVEQKSMEKPSVRFVCSIDLHQLISCESCML